jgi:hypothetical protein
MQNINKIINYNKKIFLRMVSYLIIIKNKNFKKILNLICFFSIPNYNISLLLIKIFFKKKKITIFQISVLIELIA